MSCTTCRQCKQECSVHRFHENNRVCKTCNCLNSAACKLCGVRYGSGLFVEQAMKNHIKYQAPLLCQGCIDIGYTPRDTRTYTCVHGCKRGHKKFNAKQLANHKRRHHILTCTDCQMGGKHIEETLEISESKSALATSFEGMPEGVS